MRYFAAVAFVIPALAMAQSNLCQWERDNTICPTERYTANENWFYFNTESGNCEAFFYRGCSPSNEPVHAFRTIEECTKTCKKEICELEVDIGTNPGLKFNHLLERFYYDKETGKCNSFRFYGFGGNLNNFLTIEECSDWCMANKTSSVAERSLIMLKPKGQDKLRQKLNQTIMKFEMKGYQLIAMKLAQPEEALVKQLYAGHEGKDWYNNLVEFVSDGPVVAMVWEGDDVIKQGQNICPDIRKLCGGRPGNDSGNSAKEAIRISLLFDDNELVDW